jgi:hypothetical protein|tara:strand:+ start:8382 stop:8906 length:525 start_codon:yes stop_codon:yes gene_type:complete
MARTFTIKKSSGTDYAPGWKLLTISKASYGDYNGTKYLDMNFEGYPDNMNARVYETKSKSGEEFAIAQVFRFANAGITEALEGMNGDMMVKLDDSPSHLVGKKLNAYFYKDGDYSRILKRFAPTPFENAVEKFNDNDVNYWKTRGESYFKDFVSDKLSVPTPSSDDGMPADAPF